MLNAGRSVASQNTHEREGSSITPRKVTRQERDKSTAATAYKPCVIPRLYRCLHMAVTVAQRGDPVLAIAGGVLVECYVYFLQGPIDFALGPWH